MKQLGFIKASFIYSIIGALPAISGIVLIPLYINHLSIEQFGDLSLYFVFMLLIQAFSSFGMDIAIGVYHSLYKEDAKTLSLYTSNIIILQSIIACALIAVFFVFGSLLFEKVFRGTLDFFPYGFLALITALGNAIVKIYSTLSALENRIKSFVLINVFYFLSTLLLTVSGLYFFEHSLIGPVCGKLIPSVLLSVIVLVLMLKKAGLQWKIEVQKKIIAYCTPIFILGILTWLLAYSDRYIIDSFSGRKDVAVYDLAIKCTVFIEFVVNGLELSINPRLYSLLSSNPKGNRNEHIDKYVGYYSSIIILFTAVSVFVLPLLLQLLTNNSHYAEAARYVGLAALYFVFRIWYNIYVIPVYLFKKTSVLPWIHAFVLFISIPLMIFFVNRFNVEGIILATLISRLVLIYILRLYSRKVYRYEYSSFHTGVLPVFFIVITILTYLLSGSANTSVLFFINAIVVSLLLLMQYKKTFHLQIFNISGEPTEPSTKHQIISSPN